MTIWAWISLLGLFILFHTEIYSWISGTSPVDTEHVFFVSPSAFIWKFPTSVRADGSFENLGGMAISNM